MRYVPQKIVAVRGTPYEKGRQQGESVAEIIAANVDQVREGVSSSKVKGDLYKKLLEENLGFMKKREPGLVEEMRGIADGSKIAFTDIALINIPLYFMLDILADECSMAVALGGATLDRKTYLVKNRDMRMNIQQVILERDFSDGRRVVEVNGAGILTYPGMGINNRGLAATTTGAWSKKIPVDVADNARSHILINIHSILERCGTVDEALDFLKKLPRMNGINLILADDGKAVAVEATRDRIVVEEAKEGVLVRTNHYTSSDLKGLNPDEREYPSTFRRHGRIHDYLAERRGTLRFQDMLEIASDHENGENCVCRHGLGANKGRTISTSIVVLEDRQIWTALCNPCEALTLSRA